MRQWLCKSCEGHFGDNIKLDCFGFSREVVLFKRLYIIVLVLLNKWIWGIPDLYTNRGVCMYNMLSLLWRIILENFQCTCIINATHLVLVSFITLLRCNLVAILIDFIKSDAKMQAVNELLEQFSKMSV